MIGFGCELLGMAEISHEQRKNFNQMGKSLSESSLESYKIRGDDDESENDYSAASPSKIRLEQEKEIDELDRDDDKTPDSSTKMSVNSKKSSV